MKNIKRILINVFLLFLLVFSLNSCLNSCESAKEKKARENYESVEGYVKKYGTPVEVREAICSTCRGTGKLKCKNCDGSGKVEGLRRGIFDKQRPIVDCDKCDGFGYFVCDKCGGFGKVKELR